jgi:HEAT repeat protein
MPDTDDVSTGLERMLRDPRSTGALIETALAEADLDDGTADSYPAVAILQARGTREVFDAALALCGSADPKWRQMGVLILGQLGTPRAFPEECCDALLERLAHERDRDVLASTVFALGHLANRRSDTAVAALRRHPDPHIRHGVAFALCGATAPADVQALLELMEDPYELARDWATTSIGETVTVDGPHVRDALLRRMADSDAITRAEALHGLARRGDRRAIPRLVAELSTPQPMADRFIDAAKSILKIADETQVEPEALIPALLKKLAE